jgi:ABC-type branched-subunit amino acid transport system ATPase component/ABC-type branched-subunit amino acid transport system permease subunit
MTVGTNAAGGTSDTIAASRRLIDAPLVRSLAPAVLVLVAQQVLFPAPAAIVVRGLIIGGLTALVALGMALIYRANRIVNFAQADLGFAPTVLAFLLLTEADLPYPVAVLVGLAAAVLLGAATERLVVRRFARSPRLLVTIATIGLSQVLAAAALLLPRLWDVPLVGGSIEPPFDVTRQIGNLRFDANDLLGLVLTPVAVVLVTLFLRRSDAGVAIRASADNADRASLLGVPVNRLQTVVWTMTAALAFAAVFLRSGILDLPTDTALGFGILLRALVALLLGRMTNLAAVASSAVALGALELGVEWNHGFELMEPVLGVVVALALVVRWREARAGGDGETGDASAWTAAEAVRPVPAALARLSEVRVARAGALAALAAVALALPAVLSTAQVFKASALLIYAILGLSLVVLSGWAGLVSLGQVALFAVGAAVGGAVVTSWDVDLVVALVLAAVAGAAVATVIGVPALRLRGLSLAVATFAFALATTSYLLDPGRFDWVPDTRVDRAPLLGGFDVSSETQMYYLALAVLVAVVAALRGVRAGRFGRALMALRDNERAAQAYAIDPVRTQLAAFALSGAIAALAGALFVHHERSFDPTSYSPIENLAVFTMVVVGGMSTATGAVLGALFLLGGRWFLDTEWQFLASGVGVLLILLVAPGGLAGLLYEARDRWLRAVASRRAVSVPGYSAAAPAPAPAVLAPEVGVQTPTSGARTSGADVADDVLLDVVGVEAGYGGVPVLAGVDLDVRRGEAVALLGTNGAGKSTLLRAISGLVPVQSGAVRFDGVDLAGRPAHVIAAQGVVQMPGGSGVFPGLTVAENLRVAGWLHRRDRHAVEAGVRRTHERFPLLGERADSRAGDLSGGQQQMLALAMSVLVRPKLLMIDELSLGLAPAVVAQLLRFVDQLRDEGTTLVVVEQSVNVALDLADRAVFLERGEVRFSGPARELLDRPDLLRSVFLGSASRGTPGTPPGTAPGGGPGGGEGQPVLRLEGLSVAFGGVHAVDGVSFDVGKGEIVGVIGPNGAGKTTLFDLISGFVPADGGRVLLRGRDVTGLRAPARARRGLGRSFQDARLFASLTVEESIAAALERWVAVGDPLSAAFHLPNAIDSEFAVAQRVAELIDLLGLGPYRSLFVGELSTGTRRIVDLACLLAHKPRAVLLDEPAAGIAQREVEQLPPLIRRIRDETGASLVIVEHDIPLVEEVADRLVAMDQGRVVAVGPPAGVLTDPAVLRSYLGEDQAAINRSGPGTRQPATGAHDPRG